MAQKSPTKTTKPHRKKLFAPKQPTRKVTRPTAAKPARRTHHEAEIKEVPQKQFRVTYDWISPDRIWKPKTQVWYLMSALVIMLLILLAVKLEYYTFVIALIAFLLLWFVQGTMAPWEVKHQITTEGIYSFEAFHRWDELDYFWFSERKGWSLLQLDFRKEINHPRMSLLVPKGQDQEIFHHILPHLKYGEPYEVGYNIFATAIHGAYVPITDYLSDLDQPTRSELANAASTSTKKG